MGGEIQKNGKKEFKYLKRVKCCLPEEYLQAGGEKHFYKTNNHFTLVDKICTFYKPENVICVLSWM